MGVDCGLEVEVVGVVADHAAQVGERLSGEKMCWYEAMPMVSKLSAVWRWPAAC